jgi:hypothetical protein
MPHTPAFEALELRILLDSAVPAPVPLDYRVGHSPHINPGMVVGLKVYNGLAPEVSGSVFSKSLVAQLYSPQRAKMCPQAGSSGFLITDTNPWVLTRPTTADIVITVCRWYLVMQVGLLT